jgi:hypothetical protein
MTNEERIEVCEKRITDFKDSIAKHEGWIEKYNKYIDEARLIIQELKRQRTFKPGDFFTLGSDSAVIIGNGKSGFCLLDPHTNRLWNAGETYTCKNVNAIAREELRRLPNWETKYGDRL